MNKCREHRRRELIERRDECRRLAWSGRKRPDRGLLAEASILSLIVRRMEENDRISEQKRAEAEARATQARERAK